MKRYLAALLVVLGVVGLVGVLAVGRGFADDEKATGAKCSKATLQGTYLFAYNKFDIMGKNPAPIAVAVYEVYDGNGHAKTVYSSNVKGQIIRKDAFSGNYTVKADCTGTSYGAFDLFIAPDGSKFTFVQVKPSEGTIVGSGFELRGSAKRVAP